MSRARVIEPPPTLPSEPTGGGGGGWAWLLTASGIVEAQLIRGVLEAAGIAPVALDAHNPSPTAWMFPAGDVNAPVRIFVPASMLDAARLALLECGLEVPEERDAARPDDAASWQLWVVAMVLLVALFLVGVLRSSLL